MMENKSTDGLLCNLNDKKCTSNCRIVEIGDREKYCYWNKDEYISFDNSLMNRDGHTPIHILLISINKYLKRRIVRSRNGDTINYNYTYRIFDRRSV